MATKKFYENYDHVVTPTSKNVVLEYKGDYSVYFGITVDISGKNANKYLPSYENIPTRNGDDLVITTVFISNSGSAKTVTTTVKDYFTNPYFDNNLVLESNLLKNQTYTINQNTEFGTNGLYMEKGDFNSSDFILAPKYDYEESFKLNNIYDDFVYDEKGEDNYVISSSSGRDYILEMAGNDEYNAFSGSNPHIQDLKGNDEYVAEEPDTRMVIKDYSGNDEYEAKDSATIITYDYKGNDEYIAQNSGYLQIMDYKGNDKYWFGSHSASSVVDVEGNDSYDLLNAGMSDPQAKLFIADDKGNDKFSIKNSSNIQIIDASGADKYEIENSWALSIKDDKGKDKYIIKNIDTSSTEITVSNFTIKDSSGNDKYELANVKSKYGQVLSSITDELGNDKYTVNGSNYFEFLEHSGKDTYKLIGTEENKVSNFYITDYAGNDKYTLEHINKQDPDKSSIVEKQGNDSYSIKDTQNLIITDELGNDKYTLQNRINGYINDYDGKDTYTSKGETTLWDLSITDNGTSSDTYTLNGGNLLSITDKGGNNKFTISNCYDSGINAIGEGNDTYKYTNMNDCWIDDSAGNDNYNINKSWFFNIEDYAGSDVYKFTNTEIGYITDNEGDDKYNIVKSKDINILDFDGNDTYTIDIKGIKNGHYYIDDCGSDTDSLTISGLSAKNVVYLSDIDKNGKTTGDLIILDKANKSYVQINHFYNYDDESGYILNEFDEGCIETIKAGKTTLNITSVIRNDINNIKGQIAGWLTTNDFVNVNEALSSGTTDQIAELIAYFTNASN